MRASFPGMLLPILWVEAAATLLAGEPAWIPLPEGFAPGPARICILAGTEPVSMRLPDRVSLSPGESQDVPLSSGLRLRFSRESAAVARRDRGAVPAAPAPTAEPASVLTLDARDPSSPRELSVMLEVALPGLAEASPARFEAAPGADVLFLDFRGGAEDLARGYYDDRSRRGMDLSGLEGGLHLRTVGSPSLAGSGPDGAVEAMRTRTLRIEGRVPSGRESVVLFLRPRRWLAGPGGPPGSPHVDIARSASFLGGAVLPGDSAVADRARALSEAFPALRGAYIEVGDGWQGGRPSRLLRRSSRAWLRREPGNEEGDQEEARAEGASRDGAKDAGREAGAADKAPVKRLGETLSELRGAGFTPGLWIVPHGQSDKKVFEERPSAFVREGGGNPISAAFLGPYVVDGTSEDGLRYLADLFRALRAEGAIVFRLYGLAEALAFYEREAERLSDRARDPLEVLRATIIAIRSGCGEDAVLAGGWNTPEALSDLLDAAPPAILPQDGSDTLGREIAAAARSYPRHRRCWWVESLPLAAEDLAAASRDEDARSRVRSRVLLSALTGRSVLLEGGRTSPAGRDLLSLAWPTCDVRPVDLLPASRPPRIWDLKVRADGADLVAVFNPSEWRSDVVRLTTEELALPTGRGERYLVLDLEEGEPLGVLPGSLELLVLPGHSRLVSVARDAGHPIPLGIIGTPGESLALIASASWDAGASTLRGGLRLAPGRTEASIHLASTSALRVARARADVGSVDIVRSRRHTVLRYRGEPGAAAALEVVFEPAVMSGSGPGAPPPPVQLQVRFDGSERMPALSWVTAGPVEDPWAGVSGFAVLRDGVEIGRTRDLRFLDPGAPRGATISYAVASLGPGGALPEEGVGPGPSSEPASLRVPRPASSFLDVWRAQDFDPPDAPPARRRSATGGPLVVGGVRLERGIGLRAPGRIDFALLGGYDAFEASVGIDDAARFQGSVVFVVRVDGVERHRSGVVRGGGGEPEQIRVPLAGGQVLSLSVEDGGDGNEGDLADWGRARVMAAGGTTLAGAHSHNDYLHPRPLLDALDAGFTSIEADVFLVDGRLLVGHDGFSLRADRTLEALYLDPLLERVRANGGRVRPGTDELQLLIDIKAEGEKLYLVLRETLARYAEMLTRFRQDGVDRGPVTVILSGDRPRALLAAEPSRYCAIDGRLPDLDAAVPAPPSLVPLVSDTWRAAFRWDGEGEMPEAERAKLRKIVETAHLQGRKVRFWATPSSPRTWEELLDAGVDWINADDLEGLSMFLLGR